MSFDAATGDHGEAHAHLADELPTMHSTTHGTAETIDSDPDRAEPGRRARCGERSRTAEPGQHRLRVWELRRVVTAYDAWYVAVAESLSVPLATLDRKLGRAPGPRCAFEMPPTSR
ncbi:MAG: type II toxin-antitoxin system VapC family toxin [Acidimicrobiales bacterium]